MLGRDRRSERVKTGDRMEGRPGPVPAVVRGFSYTAPTRDDETGLAEWGARSPAGRFLAALPAGMELAAAHSKRHPATIRTWISRGRDLLTAATPDGEPPLDLDEYAATSPDAESLAYVAFTFAVDSIEVAPVVQAVDTITRAATSTTGRDGDWRAADALLRRHPKAKTFRPDPRLELTGAGGGPIQVSDKEAARAALADAAARMRESLEAATATPEETPDAPDPDA